MAPTIILVELCSLFDIVVSKEDNEFWDSKKNVVCDSLSRGREPPVGTGGRGGVAAAVEGGLLRGLVDLGHPEGVPKDEQGFGRRFGVVKEFLGGGGYTNNHGKSLCHLTCCVTPIYLRPYS